MSNLPQLEIISWPQFHKLSFELAVQINGLKADIDQIVSISRGGHVLSRILSDFLNLPIFSVSIQSYQALKQHEIRITQEIAPELIKNHVLLVDEIIDTGKTLERAIPYLKGLGANQVTSVGMHYKPHSLVKPDFFVAKTNKWVVYPYEIQETVKSLWPIWQTNNLDKTHLLKVLSQGGLDESLVKYYLDQSKID